MSDFESQLRTRLRMLSELRPTPADLASRIDERIDEERPRRSPRRVVVGAVVVGIAVLAGALIVRAGDPSVQTVDPAQSPAGVVDPSEIVSTPGSRLDLPETDTPWAERAAVRACSTVLSRPGISITRQGELVAALASRGQAVCSFETPDIFSVNPDDLVINEVDTTDLYVHIVWIPPGRQVEVDSLDEILQAGGAFLSINVRNPNDSDPRSTSDPDNPAGGWVIYDGGVPSTRSVLSRLEDDRFALAWYETPVVGPQLEMNLFTDTDIDEMLNNLRINQVASDNEATPSTNTTAQPTPPGP